MKMEKEKGNGKRKRERERKGEREREKGIAPAPIVASGRAWPTGSRAAPDETAARNKREGTVGEKRKRWNND
jgi:hypothetical protein